MAISIVIPTLNEAENIGTLLDRIGMSCGTASEIIVVDDNSTDETETIVDRFKNASKDIEVSFHKRVDKKGLSSAILDGINLSRNEHVIVMDADLSHPPGELDTISAQLERGNDLVIASRYARGGKIDNWPLKRRLVSRTATLIAKWGLKIKQKDPMSGYFGINKSALKGIDFHAIGYKLLPEILIKNQGLRVVEIPYTFKDRDFGNSKIRMRIMWEFIVSVWRLYRFDRTQREKRASVRFLSKTARFFTVGALGLVINLGVTYGFLEVLDIYHVYANAAGIVVSMSSNFVLNKRWTFRQKDFANRTTLVQYAKFVLFSSAGALLQILLVSYFKEALDGQYYLGLIIAVLVAAFGNFLINKRLTFNEKIWS